MPRNNKFHDAIEAGEKDSVCPNALIGKVDHLSVSYGLNISLERVSVNG